MGRKQLLFLVVTMLVATLPSSFSGTIGAPVARGPLGPHLYYNMRSPIILKIGANTTINFTFTAQAEIFVESVYIERYGSAFEPDSGRSELVISNETLNTYQSVDYSVVVKPLTEGGVVVRVSAKYTCNDARASGYHEIILSAKAKGYEELLQTLQYSMYAFILSTVVLIVILFRLYFRLRATRANKRSSD